MDRLPHIILAGVVLQLLALPASLIFSASENFSGAGLGAVNTILTITSPGSASSEHGTVAFNGALAVVTGSQVMTRESQTQKRSIGEQGLTNAASLRVVFNAVEPSGVATSTTLDNLQPKIYNPAGTVLFNSGVFSSILLADTFTGAGNSAFVFRLDSAQASAVRVGKTAVSARERLRPFGSGRPDGFCEALRCGIRERAFA